VDPRNDTVVESMAMALAISLAAVEQGNAAAIGIERPLALHPVALKVGLADFVELFDRVDLAWAFGRTRVSGNIGVWTPGGVFGGVLGIPQVARVF
jgi:hypothetical protein